MVDSIKGTGPIQGGQPLQNKNNQTSRTETSKSSQISDEVNISEEALSIAQAEETARNVSVQLKESSDATLGRQSDLEDFLA